MRKFLDFRVLILIPSKGVIISEVRKYFKFFPIIKNINLIFLVLLYDEKGNVFVFENGTPTEIIEERIFAHNCIIYYSGFHIFGELKSNFLFLLVLHEWQIK